MYPVRLVLLSMSLAAVPAFSQSTEDFDLQKKASSRARSGGECEITVRIDQRAYVEIRGSRLRVRTLQGAPSYNDGSWCSDAIPRNPNGFQFRKVSGRGRANLDQYPSSGNGGMARIYVDDSAGGADTYRFSLEWSGGSGGEWSGGDWGGSGGSGGGWGGGGGSGWGGGGSWNNGSWSGYGNGNAAMPVAVTRVNFNIRGNEGELMAYPQSGGGMMSFRGRINGGGGDELRMDLDQCQSAGRSGRCSGTARIRRQGNTIVNIDLDGRTSEGLPISLNFRR